MPGSLSRHPSEEHWATATLAGAAQPTPDEHFDAN